MKIEITNVNHVSDDNTLTLEECGFKVGDVIETSGNYRLGELVINVIREAKLVHIGDDITISEHEYKVIE